MRSRRMIPTTDAADIFDQAVMDRALAVLTVQDGDQWRTFKARFLERDANRNFFVLDHVSMNGSQLPEMSPGRYVGVSLRHRSRKVLFATSVEAKGQYVVDDQSTIAAVRYRWPESLTELQRRAYFRTPVPDNQILLATLWPNGVRRRQEANPVVTGQLLDISCGGAFVRLNQATLPNWTEDQTLGAEIHIGDGRPPILCDVRFRGTRAENDGQLGAAIQFIGLEMSPDGRLVLQRLAAAVQRFHRLVIATGSKEWNSRFS